MCVRQRWRQPTADEQSTEELIQSQNPPRETIFSTAMSMGLIPPHSGTTTPYHKKLIAHKKHNTFFFKNGSKSWVEGSGLICPLKRYLFLTAPTQHSPPQACKALTQGQHACNNQDKTHTEILHPAGKNCPDTWPQRNPCSSSMFLLAYHTWTMCF